jgi:hypothetical protein
MVLHVAEAETLDDLDTPIVAYASPALCKLIGYDQVRARPPSPLVRCTSGTRTTHTHHPADSGPYLATVRDARLPGHLVRRARC